MPEFTPDPLSGVQSTEDLIAYVDRQLQAISRALGDAQDRVLQELHAPPAKPRERMLVFADGVNWNPGSGRGAYIYLAGSWYLIQLAGVETPPTEPTPEPSTLEVDSITPSTPTVTEGQEVTLTLNVVSAPSADTVVSLQSGDTAIATVPSSVTVLAGQLSASFQAKGVAPGSVQITAFGATTQASVILTVEAVTGDTAIDFTSWESQVAQEETYFTPHTNGTRHEVVHKDTLSGADAQLGGHGNYVLRTWTQEGDFVKSSTWHRAEFHVAGPYLVGSSGTPAGEEQWIALSVMFPNTYHFPTSNGQNTLWAQHHSEYSSGQPLSAFEIAATTLNNVTKPHFRIRLHGGAVDNQILLPRAIPFGHGYTPKRNVWYDLTMRVVWRQDNTGSWRVWLRERGESTARMWVDLVNVDTMYPGYGVYFKFGKYHPPPPTGTQNDPYNNGMSFYPQSSVYHDRLVIGKTESSVLFPGCTLATTLSS